MAKGGKSAKRKGQRLEQQVAKRLRERGVDPTAGRMPLSGGDTHLKGDIRTDLPYCFECKNTERIRFWESWQQAAEQAHYHPPVLCISANHRPTLAVVELDTLIDLLLCQQQAEGTTPTTKSSRGLGSARWKRTVDGKTVPR